MLTQHTAAPRARPPLRRAAWCAALAIACLAAGPVAPSYAQTLPSANPESAAGTTQQWFFQAYAELAVESMRSTGVPASITLAQAALESAWGASRLSREAKNFFGIKGSGTPGSAGVVWMATWEVVNGRNVNVREPFRAYSTPAESFVDHSRLFLENRRYAQAMAVRNDARSFAREIARAGYATDPTYAQKLIRLMDRYDLYRFDAR